jgi:flavocytochrome c
MSASQPSADMPQQTADVVVVGGGMAGFSAALALAEAGIEVVLLEKQAQVGGSSVLSGGSFAFAGTDLQQKMGIEDSADLLFEDLRRVGGYDNEESVVRAYVDNQLGTYCWLAEHDVRFEKLFLAAGQSVPRAHSRNPREVLELVRRAAEATGQLTILLATNVEQLVRLADGDPVKGVLASCNGKHIQINARLGVVLASGGFSRSDQLLKIFAPVQISSQRAGGPGNVGDGLLMAWQLGAGMRDMGNIKGTFGGYPNATPGEHSILLPIYVGAIAVNALGERFIDESKSYKLIGDACLQQPDAVGYQIFDQKIFDRGQPGIPTMDFEAKFERGQIHRAASLRELGDRLGIDTEGLLRTVEEYNAAVDQGFDARFQRDGLSNHYGALARIDEGPFYAYPSTSMLVATYCGVAVDSKMRVCDVFDDVIPGLYAAGEVMGGLHGNAYMTGSAIGKATIFGRLAAQSIIDAAKG